MDDLDDFMRTAKKLKIHGPNQKKEVSLINNSPSQDIKTEEKFVSYLGETSETKFLDDGLDPVHDNQDISLGNSRKSEESKDNQCFNANIVNKYLHNRDH